MAMRANSFRIALNKEFEEKVEGGLLAFKQNITRRVLESFIVKMPIDTGRARANNIVSVGRRDTSWADKFDLAGTGTMAKGLAVIKGDKDPYAKNFVQNNVPYIEILEGGSSKQAPLGIAAVTVAEIQARFL